MPQLLTLSCPNCGGALELTSRADLFKCGHCGKLALFHWGSAPVPEVVRVEEKKKWKANLLRPGSVVNWQGGELLLTPQELVFVPHDFNFGPLERAVVPLRSIKELKLTKGAVFITDIVTVIDLNGDEWSLRVSEGAELRDELQRAR